MLERYGARYRGWLANARAPDVFARHLATVHVPRRFYVERLPGIPTIRVFEALACGIPLVSAPWRRFREPIYARRGFPLSPTTAPRWTTHLRRLAADPRASRMRSPRTGLRRSAPVTHAPIAPTNCSPSPRALERRLERLRHEAGVLRLEPAFPPTGTARRPIIAGCCANLPRAAGTSRSTNPTLTSASSIATSIRPTMRAWSSGPPTRRAPAHVIAKAAEADVVVKASGVGVFDDALLEGLTRGRAARRAAGVLGRRRGRDAGGDARRRPATSDATRDGEYGSRDDLRRRAACGRSLRAHGRAGVPADLQRARSAHPSSRRRRSSASPPTSASSPTGCLTAKRASKRFFLAPAAEAREPAFPARRLRLGRQADACRMSRASAMSAPPTTTHSTPPRWPFSMSRATAWRRLATRRPPACSRRRAPAPV